MHGIGASPLDLCSLFQALIATALVLVFGSLFLVNAIASRFFDSSRASRNARRPMAIGGSDCRCLSSNGCSSCKNFRYCSQACQSKHWIDHDLNCNRVRPNKADIVSSDNCACGRSKSTGLGSISLVPACGTRMVLQEPKKVLFPYDEFVKLFNWNKSFLKPRGLLNCGNSCFANVVLQCLACTKPLIAYLLERNHSRECFKTFVDFDWCFLCELEDHIQKVSESYYSFSPINILSRLPKIGRSLGCGSQEDAHEFMRFAIDTMQSIFLDEFGGEKALDPRTHETTLIHYIYGGHLQSQVVCTQCKMISNHYDKMMDLTVEIQGDAESLEECLQQFTTMEWLDGENMYKCDGCNDYVKAIKRLTIHQAPNILTIALKRFQGGRYGKLNKRVTFPEELDLTSYMSGNGDGTDLYSLYAVVVHLDNLNASFYGHYICYVKDFFGRWYLIDDNRVVNVEVEEVLAQGAYMLLYTRRKARLESSTTKQEIEVDDPKLSDLDCMPTNLSLHEVGIGPFSNPDPGSKKSLFTKSYSKEEDSDADSIPLAKISAFEAQPIVPVPEDTQVNNGNGFLSPCLEKGSISKSNSTSSCEFIVGATKRVIGPDDDGSPLNKRIKTPTENSSRQKSKPIFSPGFLNRPMSKVAAADKNNSCSSKRITPCLEKDSRSKLKPIFPRGFIDRAAKKGLAGREVGMVEETSGVDPRLMTNLASSMPKTGLEIGSILDPTKSVSGSP